MRLEPFDVRRDAVGGWNILDEAGFAACVLDRRLRYRRISTAWRVYLQGDAYRLDRQPASWRNRAMLTDIPVEHRERWSQALQAIVDGRLGHFLDRTTSAHALGERLVVTTASPTINAEGQVDGILCVRYDVTEAQQAAANEQRLADVLLAARRLQHNLGNQLAVTLGSVELLTFDPRLPEELRDRVDEALRGVIEATDTLARLRLVTRLELRYDDPSLTEHLGPTDPP